MTTLVSPLRGLIGVLANGSVGLVRHIEQGSTLVVSLPGGPGVLDLPFALFEHDLNFAAPANFQAVGFLQFNLEFERRDSITIDSIMAVPEPNTLLLALAGGSAIIGGLHRRRVCNKRVRPGDRRLFELMCGARGQKPPVLRVGITLVRDSVV
jgi:hypothetical protein